MRGTAKPDRAFWSKPVDAEAGWMDDLSVASPDADETHALDDLAAGRHAPTDRVFHELRDVTAPAPVVAAGSSGGDNDEPHDELPPAASAAFDINSVNDDLLPSWELDLG